MKSPIIWVGGKNKMVNVLNPLIPKHKCYVEVFGGGVTYYSPKMNRPLKY